jgi:mRNA interferase RelE/StbE
MPYTVLLKPSARKALLKLPRQLRTRVIAAAEALGDMPRSPGVVKMAGDENLWRIRVGDYHIIYEIHDGRLVVLVVRVGHRRDVYD